MSVNSSAFLGNTFHVTKPSFSGVHVVFACRYWISRYIALFSVCSIKHMYNLVGYCPPPPPPIWFQNNPCQKFFSSVTVPGNLVYWYCIWEVPYSSLGRDSCCCVCVCVCVCVYIYIYIYIYIFFFVLWKIVG